MKVNKRINDILYARFTDILKSGAFPEVQYKETTHSSGHVFHSYNLMPYNVVKGRFYKIVNNILVEDGEEGIFTRKYNKVLLDKIQNICHTVTASDIRNQADRYTTWVDQLGLKEGL